jgi:LysM repeat protein
MNTVYYFVIDTALKTGSRQQQYDAQVILTSVPNAQAAQALLVSQYIIPVARATARPDGDVIHEVKNGQSMWSIAIEYGVKIDQIQQLNNFLSTDLYPGQKLLVQKGATQPAPVPTATATALSASLSPTSTAEQPSSFLSTGTVSVESLPSNPTTSNFPPEKLSGTGIAVGIIFLALLLAGLFSYMVTQNSS